MLKYFHFLFLIFKKEEKMSRAKVYIAPMPEGLVSPDFTEDALKLITERYLRRDKDGQIVEMGKHDELLEHDGIYKRLWTLQAERFIV